MSVAEAFAPFLNPWLDGVRNPSGTQESLLSKLLARYAATDYGSTHDADKVASYEEYKEHFPTLTYQAIQPYFDKVREGQYHAILSEEPLGWVMTRGSTGQSKVLPYTETHIQEILGCGARAIVNFASRRNDMSVLSGSVLNLSFPSSVATSQMGGRLVAFGYSSGTYARLHPTFSGATLIPPQEELDALGPDITKRGWEARFELIYERAKGRDVKTTISVAPVLLAFARYVKHKHGKKLKDLWKMEAIFCTSVPKIHAKYEPILRAFCGNVPVIEMYSATEGVFAQQMDELPYLVPNYDTYLLEVVTGKGVKLLHEMNRNEWGKLIISSSMLPRYDIGDMIEAMGKGYYRVFGRAKASTILEHRLYKLLTFRAT